MRKSVWTKLNIMLAIILFGVLFANSSVSYAKIVTGVDTNFESFSIDVSSIQYIEKDGFKQIVFLDSSGNPIKDIYMAPVTLEGLSMFNEITNQNTHFEIDGKTYYPIIIRNSDGVVNFSAENYNIYDFPEMQDSGEFNWKETNLKPDGQEYNLEDGKVYFIEASLDNQTAIDLNSGTSYEVDNKTFFEEIEEMVAEFLMSVAKLINWLVSISLGRTITLDNIVFNEFKEIKINFFTTNIDGSLIAEGDTSQIVLDLRTPVNQTYRFFRNIALVGYMIILVYIGIKVLLDSTTAQKKATYKTTFMAWVTGIMILFFMPFYMKYCIALNDTFVNYIGSLRTQEAKTGSDNTDVYNTSANKGLIETKINSDDPSENVINFSTGQDYMTVVGRLATETKRAGIALAYLVMSFQVIMLLIYYYKRAFIIAILIILFPLIAFTYVWDKLNDGKSQAMSEWIKEFTINIFVQTFHAIIFVFVTNTIYATLQPADNGSGYSADFILLVIASSFLFKGEAILKQIFGGNNAGDTLGTAAQTGAKIAVVTRGVIALSTRTIQIIAGKDGIIRNGVRSMQAMHLGLLLNSKPRKDDEGNIIPREDRVSRFDMLASIPAKNARINDLLPNNRPITPSMREMASTIDTLNNMDKASPQELAKAMNHWSRLKAERENGTMSDDEKSQLDAMLAKSGLDVNRLNQLDKATTNVAVASAAVAGMDAKAVSSISQTLRLEIEALYPQKDAEGNLLTGRKNSIADKVMQASLINIRDHGKSQRRKIDGLPKEYRREMRDTKEVFNRMRFITKPSDRDYDVSQKQIKDRTKAIVSLYQKNKGGKTSEEHQNMKSVANGVARIEQLLDKGISAAEAAQAMKVLEGNEEMATMMLRLAGVETDLKTLRYMLAMKINERERGELEDYTTTTTQAQREQEAQEAKKWARKTTKEMEKEAVAIGLMEQMEFITNASNDEYVASHQEVKSRAESIARAYKNKAGELKGVDPSVIERVATGVARMEQLLDKGVSASEAAIAMQSIESNQRMASMMMQLSHVQMDIRTLRYILAKQINERERRELVDYSSNASQADREAEAQEAKNWARKTMTKMEAESRTLERVEQLSFITKASERDYASTQQREEKRTDTLVQLYQNSGGGKTAEERKSMRQVASGVARIKQLLDNGASAQEVADAMQAIEGHEEMAYKMLRFVNVDVDLESLRYTLAMKINQTRAQDLDDYSTHAVQTMRTHGTKKAKKWARDVLHEMEAEERTMLKNNVRDTDPYFSILNIIEVAQRGNPDHRIDDSSDLFNGAEVSGANDAVLRRKESLVRAQNQKELTKSMEFAEKALQLEGYERRDFGFMHEKGETLGQRIKQTGENIASNFNYYGEGDPQYEQPTFNGRTKEETREMYADAVTSSIRNTVGAIVDTVAIPTATFVGATLGAAVTEDGMPIEEALVGATAGYTIGTKANDTVVKTVFRDDARAARRTKLEEKFANRIQAENKTMKEARDEYNQAHSANENVLNLIGANANMHLEADGSLSATVNIYAENAEWMSISESPVIPSSGWVGYQDSFYYQFSDRSPNTSHTLYVYVRDKSGNVKGARIDNIRL